MVFVVVDELFNVSFAVSLGGHSKQGVGDWPLMQVASESSVTSTTARNMERMVSQDELVRGGANRATV